MTEAQRQSLLNSGFVLLPEVVPRAYADELKERGLAAANEARRAGKVLLSAWSGVEQLRHMLNRGEIFERAVQHRGALQAVQFLLGNDCLLTASTLNILHASTPDHGLHVDYPIAHLATPRPTHPLLASCIWFLDDFFALNGATSVVPGSHLRVDTLPQAGTSYDDEVMVCGRKGSILVINSAVWHGASANSSGRPRVALLTYYRRRDFEFGAFIERTEEASPQVLARATPVLRRLLGV